LARVLDESLGARLVFQDVARDGDLAAAPAADRLAGWPDNARLAVFCFAWLRQAAVPPGGLRLYMAVEQAADKALKVVSLEDIDKRAKELEASLSGEQRQFKYFTMLPPELERMEIRQKP
jgi:hypothetical protein